MTTLLLEISIEDKFHSSCHLWTGDEEAQNEENGKFDGTTTTNSAIGLLPLEGWSLVKSLMT